MMSEIDFFIAGNRMNNYHDDHYSSVKLRHFREVFGTTPTVCSVLWSRIIHPTDKPKVEYLLFALIYLKVYGLLTVNAKIAKVDPKTFQYWSKKYVEAIASLDVVSS